jgi:hypothetical protein
MLAVASFAIYWRLWPTLGEAQARALSLIVLIAGYQTLVFAERLALPALAVERIPRTLVFWTVWAASAVSLVLILYIPAATQMFGRAPQACIAVAICFGVLAVGWRLLLGQRNCSARAVSNGPRKPTFLIPGYVSVELADEHPHGLPEAAGAVLASRRRRFSGASIHCSK